MTTCKKKSSNSHKMGIFKKNLFYPNKPTNHNSKTMTTIIISLKTLKPNKAIHYIILKLPNPQATIHCEHLGI